MKLLLIPFIIISMTATGQNRDSLSYTLINFKLQRDSLHDYQLSTCIASIDSVDLEVMIALLQDSVSEIDVLNKLKELKSKSEKIQFYKDHHLLAQMESSKGNWQLSKLNKHQEVYKCKKPKKSRDHSSFSLSKPIYFHYNDQSYAMLLVDHRFGGGYIEVYQQTNKGGWYKVSEMLIWLGE